MKIITQAQPASDNMVIFGPPGSGKSYNITTFTKGPILLLQTEPGDISALHNPDFAEKVASGYHKIVGIESWDELEKIRFGVEAWVARLNLNINPGMVVLDSMSWAAELCKEWVVTKYPAKSMTDQQTRVPQLQHWLIITEQMKQVLQGLQRFQGVSILIAQADLREVGEAGDTTTLYVPGIPGKYAMKIGHDVDMLLYAKRGRGTQDGQFFLETRETGIHPGKVRGFDPPKEIPFNIDAIVEMRAAFRAKATVPAGS